MKHLGNSRNISWNSIWWWLDAEHLKEVYGGLSSSRPQAEATVEEPSEYGQDSMKKNGIIWIEFDGCWMLLFLIIVVKSRPASFRSFLLFSGCWMPTQHRHFERIRGSFGHSVILLQRKLWTCIELFGSQQNPNRAAFVFHDGNSSSNLSSILYRCYINYIGIWYDMGYDTGYPIYLIWDLIISQVIPRTCICLAASKCRSLSTRWKHGVARFFWKHVWHISGLYLKPPLRPPRHGASKALCWGLEPIRGDFDPVLVGTPARWTGGSRLQTLTKRHRHFKHDRNLLHPCSSYLKSVVWCYYVICGVSTWVVWCGYITELNKAPAVSGLCFLQLAWKGRVKGRKILRRCSSKCHSSMMGQPMQLTSFCQSEHGGEECWDW